MGPKKGQERSRGGNHGVNKRYAYEKWKYNGDFQQLPTFNQRVESEVMAKGYNKFEVYTNKRQFSRYFHQTFKKGHIREY